MLSGRRADGWRSHQKEEVDFYDLKGTVDVLFKELGVCHAEFLPYEKNVFEPGTAARVVVGKRVLGALGEISPEVCGAWDIKHAKIFYAKLKVAALNEEQQAARSFQPLSDYPAVTRDISFVRQRDNSFFFYQDNRPRTGRGPSFLSQFCGALYRRQNRRGTAGNCDLFGLSVSVENPHRRRSQRHSRPHLQSFGF